MTTRFKIKSRRGRLVLLAFAAAVMVAVPVAWASDRFTDVPTSSPFHNDINTIARVGITLGCNPPTNNQYCPTANVTREQMAAFLARTLRATTPVYVEATTGPGAIDFDVTPTVCQTGSHTPTVAEHARLDSWLSANPAASAQMTFFVRNVYSTDGGTTWNNLDPAAVSRAGSEVAGTWAHATNSATLTLNQGTTYNFGIQVGRISGTTDASESRCEVVAEITYKDAGASTLGAASATTGGHVENLP